MTAPAAEGITETVSENPPEKPKRSRGRPRLIKRAGLDMVDRLYANVGSERGRNGKFYMMIALNTLVGLEDHDERARYYWLAPDGAILALMPGLSEGYRANTKRIGNPKDVPGAALRETLLTELGRVMVAYDKDTMLRLAQQLCEMEPKPTTREAVAMVRRWRLGEPDEPEPPGVAGLKLIDALAKFLDDYRATHAGVTRDVQRDALEFLYFGMMDEDEGGSGGDHD